MDLIMRNVRLAHRAGAVDIGVVDGRIAAIGHGLREAAESYDAAGRLACAGLIETHIHLDKSRLIDRLPAEAGRRINPMKRVAEIKKDLTVEDTRRRRTDPRRLHRQRHDAHAHPSRGRPGPSACAASRACSR